MKWQLRALLALSALTLTAAGCEPAAEEEPVVEAGAADTTLAPAPAPASDALLNPDIATADQLAAIPSISDSLAARIEAGQPYENMLQVDSILATELDETQREEVYAQLWKRIDLNTATEAEILLIPGVGDRMAHEFEEYRPYRGIAQFRREIGKYVDENEVARLERYVEIRDTTASE